LRRDLDGHEREELRLIGENETLSHVLEHRFTTKPVAELRRATL